jgi:hypothetical protein
LFEVKDLVISHGIELNQSGRKLGENKITDNLYLPTGKGSNAVYFIQHSFDCYPFSAGAAHALPVHEQQGEEDE